MEQKTDNGSGLVLAALLPDALAQVDDFNNSDKPPANELARLWRQANIDVFNAWLGDRRTDAITNWIGDIQDSRPNETADAVVALVRAGAQAAGPSLAKLRQSTLSCVYDERQPLRRYGRRFGLKVDVSSHTTLQHQQFEWLGELESLSDIDQIPGRIASSGRYCTTLGALTEWGENVLKKIE